MRILCVDDEAPLLAELVRAAEASPDVTQTVAFQRCSQALEWAQENRPDAAFLDIHMRGMGGMELAEKLKELYPELPVVFCTGFREYAVDAFRIRASGYLMKPVTAADVQRELDEIRRRSAKPAAEKKLTVQCFGNFEVFCGGQVLRFKRRRSKELFAYLVDRRGAAVTSREICAVLWEDEGDEQKNMAYLYKLFGDLRSTLASAGAEDVLSRSNTDYAVVTDKLDCDYYRFLANDPAAVKSFTGEYMLQYSWAEATAAGLTEQK